jgi:hypothetical protein
MFCALACSARPTCAKAAPRSRHCALPTASPLPITRCAANATTVRRVAVLLTVPRQKCRVALTEFVVLSTGAAFALGSAVCVECREPHVGLLFALFAVGAVCVLLLHIAAQTGGGEFKVRQLMIPFLSLCLVLL